MSNTVKLKCTCKNSFQDKRYGKNVRVMNKVEKQANAYRCTSCEAIVSTK